MSKTRNITDFFRPVAQPHPPQRLRASSDLTEPPSSSPGLPSTAEYVTASEEAPPQASTITTSSLTSLASDGDASDDDHHNMSLPDLPTHSASESMASTGLMSTSSHRIVKDGEVMIMNSDAESDSDISLDDIDELLASRRAPPQAPRPTFPEPLLPTPDPEPTSRRGGRVSSTRKTKEEYHAASQPSKSKYSLDALVAQAEKNTAADAQTAEVRDLIGKLDEHRAAHEAKLKQSKETVTMNVELLASIVNNQPEENNFDRLMNSIRRQDMLETTKSWSFFQTNRPTVPDRCLKFPSIGKGSLLSSMCHDAEGLYAPVLNGYMGELATKGHLPDELVHWILDASCSDPIETLRSAYLSVVSNAGSQVQPLLTPDFIKGLLHRLGASEAALDTTVPVVIVERMPNRGEKEVSDWSYLRSALRLFKNVAEVMKAESRTYTLGLLFRLSLDTAVVTDRTTLEALEDAIEYIVASFPEESVDTELLGVVKQTFTQTKDALLQLQMLNCIPSTLPQLSLIRRRLALAFFFKDPAYLSKRPPDLLYYKKIIKKLREPQFEIERDTDYALLGATISILDIGVDDGDPPATDAGPQAETEFNQKVDKLANHVRGIFAQIIDTGASHLIRTGAKDTLDVFHYRLICAVRTKLRPKKTIFGEAGGGVAGVASAEFMAKFLPNRKVIREAGTG